MVGRTAHFRSTRKFSDTIKLVAEILYAYGPSYIACTGERMVDIIYIYGGSELFYSWGIHIGHVRVRSPEMSTVQIVWLFPYACSLE